LAKRLGSARSVAAVEAIILHGVHYKWYAQR